MKFFAGWTRGSFHDYLYNGWRSSNFYTLKKKFTASSWDATIEIKWTSQSRILLPSNWAHNKKKKRKEQPIISHIWHPNNFFSLFSAQQPPQGKFPGLPLSKNHVSARQVLLLLASRSNLPMYLNYFTCINIYSLKSLFFFLIFSSRICYYNTTYDSFIQTPFGKTLSKHTKVQSRVTNILSHLTSPNHYKKKKLLELLHHLHTSL